MGYEADLLFTGGQIYTGVKDAAPVEALAVWRGRILALGSGAELAAIPARQVIDLKGRTLMPGFIDAHSHLSFYSVLLTHLDCRCKPDGDIHEILTRIQARAKETPPGKWIRGWGFADYRVRQRRYPTRAELDEAAPDQPVAILHASGHSAALNSRALQLSRLDRNTPDPQGGSLERDPATGELTGVLHDAAVMPYSLDGLFVEFSKESLERQVEVLSAGSREYARLGITTTCDAAVSPLALRAYQAAGQTGQLKNRVMALPSYEWARPLLDSGIVSGFGAGRVRIGAIKIIADGSLSGRTAAVSQPYIGTNNTGLLYYDQEKLDQIVTDLDRRGFQIATHTIGDQAVRQVLHAYAKVIGKGKPNLRRHRMEHVGLVNPELVQELAELDMAVATQPRMLYEQGDGFSRSCRPEQVEWLYPYRAFIESGLHVGGSSDCPVVSPDPLLGMRDGVLRQTECGLTLAPAQRLDPEQSLHMWHDGSAYVLGLEQETGTLEAGKLADLVVLSGDPLATAPEAWGSSLAVEMTVTGGEIVYSKE